MDLDERVLELEKTQAAAEEQHKTLFRRVANLEEEQKTMHAFAVSLEKMATSVGNVEKKVDTMCKEVEDIKAKPAKRWETMGMKLLELLLAAVAGYMLSKMGLG